MSTSIPPKNGIIALLLTTNGLMCSKYVSQKRNEAMDNKLPIVQNVTQFYIVNRNDPILD